ncbi:hypothetical protein AB0758_49085 [Tolypothrix bouteillei VB521301_2]|uniref:hypothetical protein n=1 Tax=Tolypothrix bouteillei TaxID=1246981 RepID=UPI000513D97A
MRSLRRKPYSAYRSIAQAVPSLSHDSASLRCAYREAQAKKSAYRMTAQALDVLIALAGVRGQIALIKPPTLATAHCSFVARYRSYFLPM